MIIIESEIGSDPRLLSGQSDEILYWRCVARSVVSRGPISASQVERSKLIASFFERWTRKPWPMACLTSSASKFRRRRGGLALEHVIGFEAINRFVILVASSPKLHPVQNPFARVQLTRRSDIAFCTRTTDATRARQVWQSAMPKISTSGKQNAIVIRPVLAKRSHGRYCGHHLFLSIRGMDWRKKRGNDAARRNGSHSKPRCGTCGRTL